MLRVVRPGSLSSFQEWLLQRAWEGATYTAMADEKHYRVEYIRRIGAELWAFLSEYFGQPIAKPYLREVLASRDLTDAERKILERSKSPDAAVNFPSGPLPLDSPLYIPRPPIEESALDYIARPGSLIHIKAPAKMGKTSLALRLLDQARVQAMEVVFLNFQQADSIVFTSIDRLLRWFCANLSRRLKLEIRLDDYWNLELGSKMSCTYYLEEYILSCLEQPLVLLLDEVNRLFQYPQVAEDFLPLLSLWHTQAHQSKVWQNLRLVLAYSAEPAITLDFDHSPSSVGLPLELSPLNASQVQTLTQKWGVQMGISSQFQKFMKLTGGLPYLVQIGLYYLSQSHISLEELLKDAPTETGIYKQHLRQQWAYLRANPLLLQAYHRVIADREHQPDAIAVHQLYGLGLVKFEGNVPAPACGLYHRYFAEQLTCQV